jgi:hypothetical protein
MMTDRWFGVFNNLRHAHPKGIPSGSVCKVHLVYPSLIGTFVLTTCAWRRIPATWSRIWEPKMVLLARPEMNSDSTLYEDV